MGFRETDIVLCWSAPLAALGVFRAAVATESRRVQSIRAAGGGVGCTNGELEGALKEEVNHR
jgi:hypothetical protein